MPRLLLILALGFIAYIAFRRLQGMPAQQRKSEYLKIGLVVLVGLVILLTVTGRMHWLGAAFTALLVGASRLLPVLIRLFPMLQWLQRQRSSSASATAGQQSNVETALLRLVLDHDSGDMSGEVLAGEFAGRQLDGMDQSELEQLLSWCASEDVDSARLLESYLQRRFGTAGNGQQYAASDSGGNMGRAEALAILGLEDNASEQDIVDAHRRLMQKLHPDRGGNDYLAAKLNQAKDTLTS